MQSTCNRRTNLHVAIIMDGNGRWATRRGLPRTAGHRSGVATVRRLVETIGGLGVSTLTLFAFSADNWRRPTDEVGALMALLHAYLRSEGRRLVENGMRLSMIGRRDRLPDRLVQAIAQIEETSASADGLHLRVALDYSSRDAILRAACRLPAEQQPTRESFGRLVAQAADGDTSSPAVDLLIRTGGEKRLSDFLLWESAYAELWFTDTMWPDFTAEDLRAAIAEFHRRDRRFGSLSNVA